MSSLFASPSPIAFTVYGTPRPQGSARLVPVKGYTRPFITSDNKRLKPWRQEIVNSIMQFVTVDNDGNPILQFERDSPLEVTMNFYFLRPKSAKKRRGMTVKPDSDKLVRAIFDSLKGVLIHDDAQIVEHHCRKHYGGPERVEVSIREAVA